MPKVEKETLLKMSSFDLNAYISVQYSKKADTTDSWWKKIKEIFPYKSMTDKSSAKTFMVGEKLINSKKSISEKFAKSSHSFP